MARFSDSEHVIWALAAQVRMLHAEYANMQRVLAALVSRSEGILVISAEELAEAGTGSQLRCSMGPDGAMIVWVPDEPAEPGCAG